MEFAFVHIGISLDDFWNLSWYEFNLYVMRYEESEKEKHHLQEMEWVRIRKIWVLMINYIRDHKSKPMPFRETDLIRLSFDEPEQELKPLLPEEVEAMFPKTLIKLNGNIQ
jgi:hypothetical protein